MFENRRSVAVCLSGHLVDPDLKGLNNSESNYCDSCGKKAIEECPNCYEPIRGEVRQAPAGEGPLGGWIKEQVSRPDFCSDCGHKFPWASVGADKIGEAEQSRTQFEFDPIELVTRICRRFPVFVNQLNKRHNDRAGIEFEDEYDVQDVLHPILRMFFDDVRAEESTESHAGGSSRIDFLLRTESIGIEVKFMRESSSPQELGDELLADKETYATHSDCDKLVSFIFDPHNMLSNPKGLENDLTYNGEEYSVTTIVAPKGD